MFARTYTRRAAYVKPAHCGIDPRNYCEAGTMQAISRILEPLHPLPLTAPGSMYLRPGSRLTPAQTVKLFAIVGHNSAEFRVPFKGITNYEIGEVGKRGEAFMAGRIGGGLYRWNLSYEDSQTVLTAE